MFGLIVVVIRDNIMTNSTTIDIEAITTIHIDNTLIVIIPTITFPH